MGLFLIFAILFFICLFCVVPFILSKSKSYTKQAEEHFSKEYKRRTEQEKAFNEAAKALGVNNVSPNNINTVPKEKNASVVGRAVAGGIIAGGAGAVVGAISALDKNQKNNSSK